MNNSDVPKGCEPVTKGGKSVFEIIDKHSDLLEAHDKQLQVQKEQIKQLQDNAIKLENVVMTENRETRLTVTQTNNQLVELINGLMGYKSGKHNLDHTERIARWESISKIVGILAGSGGILYYILQ